MGNRLKSEFPSVVPGSQCSICGIYFGSGAMAVDSGNYRDGKYICQSCRPFCCIMCNEPLRKDNRSSTPKKMTHFIKICESCIRDYKIDDILK